MTSSPLAEACLLAGMEAALAAARGSLGTTWPNPPVGAAALDAQGRILACAAHRHVGGLHAEAALLEELRARAMLEAVHTLCVTLEPCNHQGRTPPCTDLLIHSGIRHLAIGVTDPNPHVCGGGIEALRAAGIALHRGILAQECALLIAPFRTFVTEKRPWLTVKRAWRRGSTHDTMIPPQGKTTFMPHAALHLAHRLRKRAQAILTGSGTILADNPSFTVRHVLDHPRITRTLIVLDRRRRVPEAWLAACPARGLNPVVCSTLDEAFEYLRTHALVDVLVEAGSALSEAVYASGAWSMGVELRETYAQSSYASPITADITFAPHTGIQLSGCEATAEGVAGFPECWLPVA